MIFHFFSTLEYFIALWLNLFAKMRTLFVFCYCTDNMQLIRDNIFIGITSCM